MYFLPRLLALTLGAQVSAFATSPQEEIAQKVPQARTILEAWKAGAPTDAVRTLHIIYWTPADREPAPQYRERLTRCMTHVQDFYGVEMNRLGFGAQSINLDFEDDKLLKIHLVTAPKPYAHYKPGDGEKIRNECLPTLEKAGIDASKETIVIFSNMSDWDPVNRRIVQNSPYYARGSHRKGTAWLLDSPILDSMHLDKKEPKLYDRQYGHISVGKYNSIFVGGIAHELGHALGLPHNCERADERAALGTALMGGGNRTYGDELRDEGKGSFLTLASGLRLASHPMLTGSIKAMELPGNADLTNIKVTKGDKSLVITGKVETKPGSPPVYAVLAYTDPEGGSNYDATTATAIPDAHGQFELHSTDLNRNGPANLRLIVLYANGDATSHIGSHSPFKYPYLVGQDGQPDLTCLDLVSAFDPVVRARQQKGNALNKALTAISQSKDPQAAAIAQRMLRNTPLHPAPHEIDPKIQSVALADSTPASAKVGYGRPLYNRLPTANMLIQARSSIFQHGIYAHAPAHHSYSLGGKWKRLSGQCGLAQNNSGSVVFVIKADNKEIWRSQRIQAGKLAYYDLNVSGKQKLELIVQDAGDGNGSDWGLWLEPTLSR